MIYKKRLEARTAKIIMLMVVLLGCYIIQMSSVSSYQCYQETANISTSCGVGNSGSYMLGDVSRFTNPSHFYDGIWSTTTYPTFPGTCNQLNCTLYSNYSSYPSTASSGSVWRIKYVATSGSTYSATTDYTIPDRCLVDGKINVFWRTNTTSDTQQHGCINNTGGFDILNTLFGSGQLYEEALFWNLSSITVPANYIELTGIDASFDTANYYLFNDSYRSTGFRNTSGGNKGMYINNAKFQISPYATNITFYEFIEANRDTGMCLYTPSLRYFYNKSSSWEFYTQLVSLSSSGMKMPYGMYNRINSGEINMYNNLNIYCGDNNAMSFNDTYISYQIDTRLPLVVPNITNNENRSVNLSIRSAQFFINSSDNFMIGTYRQHGSPYTQHTACYANINSVDYQYECSNGGYSGVNVTGNLGINSIYFYAYDDAGNLNRTQTFSVNLYDSNVYFNSQSYNNITDSYMQELFNLNLTYDSNYYSINNIYLVYNSRNYSTGITGASNNIITYSSLFAPLVVNQTNISFYWLVGLSNSSGINWFRSLTNNQTVNPISIDNCNANKNVIFNLTNYDQDTLIKLNGSTFNVQLAVGDANLANYYQYSNNFTGVDSAAICISNITSSFRMDSVIQTSHTGHYTQFYNIQNYTLSNLTTNQNISILDLNSSSGIPFKINIKDFSFNPVSNVLVEIDRQYVSSGDFKAVEIPLTDSRGSTIGHFVLNNQLYNIYVKRNGVLLASFTNQQVYCNPLVTDCVIDYTLTQNVESFTGVYGDSGIYVQNQEYNSTTNGYSFDFSSTDGTPRTVTMTGTVLDNFQNTTAFTVTAFASSGTLTGTIPSTYSNSTILIKVYSNGNLAFQDTIQTDSFSNGFGKVKYLIAALLIPALVLMAGSSASVALIIFIIGLGLCALLFIGGNSTLFGASSFVIFFTIAAILLIWKAVKGGVKNG